jgi:putative nucleotidyltransferase with HDIG domain
MPERQEQRILIIDEEQQIRIFLRTLLSEEGYNVTCVPDGGSAISQMSQFQYDLVITDISIMANQNIRLAEFIKDRYPDTIIMVLTGYGSIEHARDAVFRGVEDYILKPLQNDEVLKRVRNSIEKASYSKENARLKEAVSLFQKEDAASDSPLKKENLYRIIVESALSQTRSSLGALVLYDEEKRKFEITYCSYIGGGIMHFPHDHRSYAAIDFVMHNKKPILLTSLKKHRLVGRIDHAELSSELFPEILPFEKEVIIFPMMASHSHVIGFLVVSKKKEEPSFARGDLQMLTIIAGQSSVSVHNAYLVEGLERNYVNTLMALNAILEAKHPYTKGHTQRVTLYSTTMAREMGLSNEEIQIMRDGAMLHDIGKIGVSDAILNKDSSLDDKEFNIIRKHPIIGETIIKPIKFLERTLPIIRNHHERMDGRGWPDGLAGIQIPLLVRICTVADAYDAMSSDRPYRETLNSDQIRRQLIGHCGTQFDEELVEIFLRLMDKELISLPENIDQPVLMKI